MAIEFEDLQLIKDLRDGYFTGKSCAILGDCNIHGNDLTSFAEVMGFDTVDTFDINGNPTYKIDLNDPIPERLYQKYDWVIDSGTLYCCFDISTVWKNITDMLKDEGCVLHTGNLVGFFGRGFYSLSPSLFRDFYAANNFETLKMATKTRQGRAWDFFDSNSTYLKGVYGDTHLPKLEFQEDSGEYIPYIPNDAMICCFAHRKKKETFSKPIPRHFVVTNGH